jgi:hypothetical protein
MSHSMSPALPAASAPEGGTEPGGLPLVFLDFIAGGNAAAYLLDGWSYEEECGRWSDGPRCSLALPPVPCAKQFQLAIRVVPNQARLASAGNG